MGSRFKHVAHDQWQPVRGWLGWFGRLGSFGKLEQLGWFVWGWIASGAGLLAQLVGLADF